MHLRVAVQVVVTAMRFQSQIQFRLGRRRADAKSILQMLALAVVRGQRLALVAQGADAQPAAQALADLFASSDTLCKDDTPPPLDHSNSP